MKQALTIAGSDSGGGAGIQADLKTFHAHGVFGTSVITAVTAQNTVAVSQAFDLPTDLIKAQLDAVLSDFDISAAKTGMLSSAEIIRAVADSLRDWKFKSLVIDPVMISKSGYKLLRNDAIESLQKELIPMALVVTPNIHEAEILTRMEIDSPERMHDAARKIHDLGCKNVIVKGGHAGFNRATDILFDGENIHTFESWFVETKSVHGTGCTFSAAITARLALGESVLKAVRHAKKYITETIENAPSIGSGHGPTHHFYFLTPDDFMKKHG
ncbi:MAG: bifunctional hydroxymethylpyrimidine kinase/phosphomethylpyrimidine kinase [Candidatus Latescibacteria bacterium]|nr:bifunctional hydroxymethylpyrimidine kinase/phosphomethylpyrimidine kinase [Candidatus Latescibacterota bacterium]NIM21797.1 bifunctional hydroxymethylpyrimidine kinase/phosphomethylpyrimidine kinase [Candidatus Latescibacterota bacterium]NIM65935.1 bifunctional hydroxymethylpyrimidine kinase/phosphomethylpyrimidine kinase [Candidatus Latescibacterota bacterium]NIO02680.1 bifunctional hydroxymethylpyrimidine kinase/phosphomethylpyrimidine kinase [Candidatus Latescibacterota bacterium]NIO2966